MENQSLPQNKSTQKTLDPASYAAMNKKHRGTALLLEILPGIFGLFGLGWLTSQEILIGVALLGFSLLWISFNWFANSVFWGIGLICYFPVTIILSVMSTIKLSKTLNHPRPFEETLIALNQGRQPATIPSAPQIGLETSHVPQKKALIRDTGEAKPILWQRGVSLIAVGIMFLGIKLFSPQAAIAMIVLGVLNLLFPWRGMFLLNGLFLMGIGVMNIISVIHSPGTGGFSFWQTLGVFQIVWGGEEMGAFGKHAPKFSAAQLDKSLSLIVEPESRLAFLVTTFWKLKRSDTREGILIKMAKINQEFNLSDSMLPFLLKAFRDDASVVVRRRILINLAQLGTQAAAAGPELKRMLDVPVLQYSRRNIDPNLKSWIQFALAYINGNLVADSDTFAGLTQND